MISVQFGCLIIGMLCAFLMLVDLIHPPEAERVFSFSFCSMKFRQNFWSQPFSTRKKWAKNLFFVFAVRGRVRSAQSLTFTHPGAVQFHSSRCVFIDRPLAPAAEVSPSARALSERNEKGKDTASVGRDKALQL